MIPRFVGQRRPRKDGNVIIFTENSYRALDRNQATYIEWTGIAEEFGDPDPIVRPDSSAKSYSHLGFVFHINKLFPQDFRDWTIENFILEFNGVGADCWHGSGNNVGCASMPTMTKEYDASTGKLIIRGARNASNEVHSNSDDSGRTEAKHNGYTLYIIS